ncbi:hypothetical protein WS68_05915 [Burkholderia sp. TSV86]|nr:hypothetical protein WS68_05915 [Burkholderia sp. TSV86]
MNILAPTHRAHATDGGAVAREWTLEGHGIVMESILGCSSDLKADRLRQLLPEPHSPDAPAHVLFQRSQYLALRIRALPDFLSEQLAGATAALKSSLDKRRIFS